MNLIPKGCDLLIIVNFYFHFLFAVGSLGGDCYLVKGVKRKVVGRFFFFSFCSLLFFFFFFLVGVLWVKSIQG